MRSLGIFLKGSLCLRESGEGFVPGGSEKMGIEIPFD
ncbi:hypothetical protein COLO4_04796 [Corchorus olitorius]|uniref:Uncharacterized protein n=1 Tax=Corchorus olitorius TaxID=93759 RepID=A0A1R3KSW1_9ROSI|nr:hypothetical protein COLO4_04796 [Corchorus olitorius]